MLHHFHGKSLGIAELLHPVTRAADLVAIAGADPPSGGTDGPLAPEPLFSLVDLDMVAEDQVRFITDKQPAFQPLELLHLFQQRFRGDDDAIADDVDRLWI